MNWIDVRGQRRPMRMLQMAWTGQRMPHAWLFYGPAGAGKEMLAVRFARLLLCEQPVEIDPPADAQVEGLWHDACGRCRPCHLIEVGTHPDLHLVHREMNKQHPDPTIRNRKAQEMSVEVIRHFVLDPVRGRSAMGRGKVYIVREAELLSTAAQNALLKTLEEPPPETYIILLSTTRDRLLPTTISRCQSVGFASLDVEAAREIIAGCGVDPAEAPFYAALSEGRPGWALQLAGLDLRGDYAAIVGQLAQIGAADPVQVAGDWQEIAQRWAKSTPRAEGQADDQTPADQTRRALQVLLVVLNSIFLDALRLSAAGAGEPVLPEARGAVEHLAGWGGESLAAAIRQVAWTESAIARNANTALTMEALAVKLAACSRGTMAISLSEPFR